MYKYEKRYKYPHMMPLDVAIWERFIDANPNFFDSVDYDVALGSKPLFDVTVNTETGGEATRLYQKKIDVVGYKDKNIYIVEIKPQASLAALGQAKSYEILYRNFIDPDIKTIPTILTDRVATDLPMIAFEMGIKLLTA